ncbi:Sialidase [Rhexocercosporidium sp. MPI-PUGE-AT-0058]|nr:Sialidase [Rhexocercosporidium sp. MPI-PUGE-AT-0058]
MLLLGLAALLVSAQAAASVQPFGYFNNNTIYTPTAAQAITYPRYVELTDGTIILTGSFNQNNSLGFNSKFSAPIFLSDDGGAHWEHISDLDDELVGTGTIGQPFLAELTEDIGDYKAGTILLSGSQWNDNGTRIDLYASRDRARSWEWIDKIAEGLPDKHMFETYLLQYKGQLVVYYSDERDELHSQKLAHQVTSDLKTWGPVVTDVDSPPQRDRPGMSVVAYIPPIDQWILVYEFQNFNNSTTAGIFPVYYRLAKSPLEFSNSVGRPIIVKDRFQPNSSPYVVWSPHGGVNGTIIVSAASHRSVFTNSFGGTFDKWEEHSTPAGVSYARSLQISMSDPDRLLIYGGDTFGQFVAEPGTVNHTALSVTAISLNKTLSKLA